MTDTPNRTIGGLAPRTVAGQPDLTRLQRRNRPAAAPTPVYDREERAPVTRITRTEAPSSPEPTAATTEPVSEAGHSASQDRITVYLDHELRGRARTAYRATAHLEGDRTWSDFIERAIRAEVERREHAHNSNQTYSSSVDKLPPGRTVS